MSVDCDLFFCTHGRDCVLWPKPWRCKVVTRSGHCVPSKAWPSYSPHPHASCINDYIRIILQVTLIEVYGFPNFINPTRDGGGCSAYQPPPRNLLTLRWPGPGCYWLQWPSLQGTIQGTFSSLFLFLAAALVMYTRLTASYCAMCAWPCWTTGQQYYQSQLPWCVQELTTILGPQNRTQGSCAM